MTEIVTAGTAEEPASIDERWAQWKADIDLQLNAVRPARIAPDDYAWREPVYEWAETNMPPGRDPRRALVREVVNKREGTATKRANEHIRAYARGQAPLSWSWLGALPISVPNFVVVRDAGGRPILDENGHRRMQRKGEVRVRFDAATAMDLEEAAEELARDGQRSFNSVMEVAEALRDIARRARHEGLVTVASLGDLRRKQTQAGEGDGELLLFMGEDD